MTKLFYKDVKNAGYGGLLFNIYIWIHFSVC